MEEILRNLARVNRVRFTIIHDHLVDWSSSSADMEPFDEPLDKNIWSLSDQRHKVDQQIAILRRTKPQERQALLLRDFNKQNIADEDDTLDLEDQDEEMDVEDGESSEVS